MFGLHGVLSLCPKKRPTLQLVVIHQSQKKFGTAADRQTGWCLVNGVYIRNRIIRRMMFGAEHAGGYSRSFKAGATAPKSL